jgi:hypothetical protein
VLCMLYGRAAVLCVGGCQCCVRVSRLLIQEERVDDVEFHLQALLREHRIVDAPAQRRSRGPRSHHRHPPHNSLPPTQLTASRPHKSLPAAHTNHCQPPTQLTASREGSHTAHCQPGGVPHKSLPAGRGPTQITASREGSHTNHCQQGGVPHKSLPAGRGPTQITASRPYKSLPTSRLGTDPPNDSVN